MRISTRSCGRAAALLALCLASRVVAATPDEVDDAIRRGVEFLYASESYKANGNWEEIQNRRDRSDDGSLEGGQWGGKTALVTYALLASGESQNGVRLKQPIEFLKRADIVGIYALGLRAQIWPYLRGGDVRTLTLRDYARLSAKRPRVGWGLYGYTHDSKSEWFDLSASQYGVLGMWACTQVLEEADDAQRLLGDNANYWRSVEREWRGLQDKPTGGWAYRGGGNVSPSMAAAGLATLFIAQDHQRGLPARDCQGNQSSPEIDAGLDYLAAQIPELFNPAVTSPHRFYTIYGVERVGVASGLKYFRDVDWYQAGSDYLLKLQRPDGSWEADPYHDETVSTAFALLFLSRGREPVAMNKIKYHATSATADGALREGVWNQRGRDVANATRFIGRQTERTLNWQIIDLAVAQPHDLRDAPIAYLSGSQPLRLPAEHVAALKRYVEEGGMLVFNGDCRNEDYFKSVRKLLNEMLDPYELQPLAPDHPIYTRQQFRRDDWAAAGKVSVVSNGVRVLAVVLEGDLGASLQINSRKLAPQPFEFMVNLYQYAIDKRYALVKGRSYVIEPHAEVPIRSTLRVGRLRYVGNWNPEPGGWRRLAAWMRNEHGIDLQVSEIDLSRGDLGRFDLLHLTGTGTLKLDAAALQRLAAFVERGGTLVIDAAGGNVEFATSVEALLPKIHPDAREGGALIPTIDPLLARRELEKLAIRYREFTQSTVGRTAVPRLRGTEVGAGYGIVYSSDDLSAGLVGNEVDGIRGYAPQTALDLMTRILLTANERKSARKDD